MTSVEGLSENLYPYLFYQDLVELQAARDADVADRLLNPERECFIRELQEAASDACFYELTADGKRVLTRIPKGPSDLEMTVGSLENLQAYAFGLDDEGALTDAEVMVTVVNEIIPEDMSHAQLRQAILCLGMIAAQYKPHQDRLEAVWAAVEDGRAATLPVSDDNVYRCAINLLDDIHGAAFRWKGEEQTIKRKLPSFEARIKAGQKLSETIDTLNRYDYGRLARRILQLVDRPSTTRRDTLDEVAVWLGDVEPAVIPPPVPGYTGPILKLPWPLLPSPERERSSPSPEPRSREPVARGERVIIRDPWRTRWLGVLAMQWPYASYLVEIDLRSVGVDENEYEAAVLYGPDEKVFAAVAETEIADPSNSLHVAVEADLRDALGRPIEALRVLGDTKQNARNMGSRQINHGGLDFHKRIVGLLRTKFREQYGRELVLSGRKQHVDWLPSQRKPREPPLEATSKGVLQSLLHD